MNICRSTFYVKKSEKRETIKHMKMNQDEKYLQSKWSLSDLIPDQSSEVIDQLFSNINEDVSEFEDFRPLLNMDLSEIDFMNIINRLEQIHYKIHILYAYAELKFSEDTQDQTAATLLTRVEQYIAEISNRIMFFTLWWKGISGDFASKLMENSGDYYYWLEEMRHFKDHTLSEPEEQIINLKNVTGNRALNTLYDSITNRYIFKLEIEGEEKELTRGELSVYIRNENPDIRANAYQELYRVYGEDSSILGQIYQSLVRDWRNEQINLRNFKNPISSRNLANDIPDQVVDLLLEKCKENRSLFQRYFSLKAKWIGENKLCRYDIYAPISASKKQYTYEQSVDLVLNALDGFDPNIMNLAFKVFDENHIDSEVRKGKRSGAFCLSAVQDITPWVLVNYQGKVDDILTMAHEMGHAIHSMLASKHSLFTFHPCLPLAETASTFSEMIVVDSLLAKESDKNLRRDLLFRQLDDAYATIQRQAFFAIFEKEAHNMIVQNASVDDLSNAYMDNLAQQFGDSVTLSPEFKLEWVSIPHIYSVPFYVYAYSFGQLLVFSLYKQYKTEGEAFIPRYLNLLSTGGSQSPETILAKSGIDFRQESFWQGGFDIINNLLDQLEKLPINKK